jgi:hypothetical protein
VKISIQPGMMLRTANMYGERIGGMLPVTNLAVTVTSESANSWTFTTDPTQHFFDGTVSFSSTDAGNGNITFSVNVSANWVSQTLRYTFGPVILAGEDSTWNNMLDNVQGFCQLPVGK